MIWNITIYYQTVIYLIVTFFKQTGNFRWDNYFFIHDYTLDDRQVTKVTDVVVSVSFSNKPMFFL